MVSINAGQLREKIAFYSINRVSDGGGGFTATEVLAFETFADVRPLKSIRSIEAAKLILMQPYQVTIRYAQSHKPEIDMIVKYRSSTFLVKEITDEDVFKKLVRLIVVKE